MLKKIALIVTCIATASCESSDVGTYPGPSGETLVTVRCKSETAQCFAKATEACGGKYVVVDSYSNSGGLLADAIPGPITWYTMTAQCGVSDGKIPTFPFRSTRSAEPMSSMPQATATSQPIHCTSNTLGGYTNTTCY